MSRESQNHGMIARRNCGPRVGNLHRFCAFTVVAALAFTLLVCASALAEESILISVGPRIGFSTTTPLMGKQQKYYFHLYDVAALFRLPWQAPLGDRSWKIETRLMTSAGAIDGGGGTGLMATLVPDLALSGWNGLVSFDVGAGLGFFPRYKFGIQNFGGPVQIVATAGITLNPVAHAYTGVRVQHFSDAGVYGPNSLGVDMYIVEMGYRF
jgi:hypothetical protein